MANGKLIAGAVLILLNLAVLAPIATSMVEDAVDDNFETYPYDTACADADCTTAEEDWATSTSERTYYAWNLTNVEEVMAGGEADYEKLGPFEYDITYTRNIIEFDKEAGTLTYNESKVFTCSETSPNDCNTIITQLNIPFQPQVVGATGLAVDGVMEATKAGFTRGVMAIELESFSAAEKTASDLETTYMGIQAGAVTGSVEDAATASAMIGNGWFTNNSMPGQPAGFNEWFRSQDLNDDGAPDGLTYLEVGGSSADFTDLTSAFESTSWITGEDASLTGMEGVLLLAGHCAAFETKDYQVSDLEADLGNNPAFTTGVLQRAGIWGYLNPADLGATLARDYATCYGVGGTFSQVNGGADDDWYAQPTAVNASTRIMNYLGVDIDNTVATGLLFGGQDTDNPTGILATNEAGSSFGLATFMGMESADAMNAYTLDATQYSAVKTWVGGWLASVSELPMALLGGTGTITAEQFVNVTFGNEDPVNGGYLERSLNLGGAWGTSLIPASDGAPSIALDAAVSGNILYGPLGLTTSNGAGFFLFGELMGVTPPLNMSNTPPTPEEGGVQMPWNTSTVATLYGVDENAANAIRTLMMNVIYGDFVPNTLLVDTYQSSGKYMTMPLNNWLYGWRDPVGAILAGNASDPNLGWAKLETNETYYGSDEVSTGPASVYVMCTGHNPDCEKGEAVSEDGSEYLSWRNMEMMSATYGLVTPQSLAGTTGGFITGSGDLVDAGGYAVTDIVCDGTGELKGIPVDECSASVDPTGNPITAKLIKRFALLDAMTPALPVYFGAEISMQSEQLSGLIIAGDSTSTFYFDNRTGTDLASTPTMDDLQPVFQIVQGSEIEDGDAEEMESAIVQNQEFMGWWMNFDNGFDYVGLLLYLGGFALIAMHFFMSGNKDEESIE